MTLKSGLVVRTNAEIGDGAGIFVAPIFFDARRPDTVGRITGLVAGHGGEVYWVQHLKVSAIAAYARSEFEIIDADEYAAKKTT